MMKSILFQTGGIYFFFIEDWRIVSDYRHTSGIKNIYAEPSGRRLVLVDEKGEGYIYNPVSIYFFSIVFTGCIK